MPVTKPGPEPQVAIFKKFSVVFARNQSASALKLGASKVTEGNKFTLFSRFLLILVHFINKNTRYLRGFCENYLCNSLALKLFKFPKIEKSSMEL